MDISDLHVDQEATHPTEGEEICEDTLDAGDARQIPTEKLASWCRPQGGWGVGC